MCSASSVMMFLPVASSPDWGYLKAVEDSMVHIDQETSNSKEGDAGIHTVMCSDVSGLSNSECLTVLQILSTILYSFLIVIYSVEATHAKMSRGICHWLLSGFILCRCLNLGTSFSIAVSSNMSWGGKKRGTKRNAKTEAQAGSHPTQTLDSVF